MSRCDDTLTAQLGAALNSLFRKLKAIKPRGWSVVRGRREIVVRPEDRSIGKYSIACGPEDSICVAFFSRSANIWMSYKYFAAGGDNLEQEILKWALSPESRAYHEEDLLDLSEGSSRDR